MAAITYQLTLTGLPPFAFTHDLTADLIAADWHIGAEHPDQAAAPPGRARFTLHNRFDQYTPTREAAVAGLVRGATIALTAHADGTPIRLFTGQVDAVTTTADHPPRMVIGAVTVDAMLTDRPVERPPLANVEAGTAIRALIDALPLPRPDHRAWARVGSWRVERATSPSGPLAPLISDGWAIDAGISRFAYVPYTGDNAAAVLRDLVVSADGRWAAGRDGVPRFVNRHAALRAYPPPLTIGADVLAVDYTWGERVYSRVRVQVSGWQVGAFDTALWTLAAPLRLDPGWHALTTPFYWNDRPAAALSITRLELYATTARGVPLAISAIVETSASASARLLLGNLTGEIAYLQPGSRVRGQPVIRADPLIVEAANDLVLHEFAGTTHTLTPPYLSDPAEARDRAAFVLGQAGATVGRVSSVTVAADRPGVLAITLGDAVSITAGGESVTSWVIGEAHTLDAAAQPRHTVRWIVTPVRDAGYYFTLDTAALDTTSALAY